MKKINNIGWKIYFLIATPIMIGTLIDTFNPSSILYEYYHILIAFHQSCIVFYILQAANSLTTALSLIPLFCYIFRIDFLAPRLWQGLFAARIIFDFTDHSYELVFLKSIFYANTWNAALLVIASLLFLVPSYLAGFRYAFKKNHGNA